MRDLKVAIIGAGSTYSPELIDGFLQRMDTLSVDSFYLMDIDESRLNIIAEFMRRMLLKKNNPAKVKTTLDLESALSGADYVLAQVRVGLLDARINDEKIPLKYGLLGQETTGIGGFMNALRTIPVMMDLVKLMERVCPDATLINFSNPSGIIAETLSNNFADGSYLNIMLSAKF